MGLWPFSRKKITVSVTLTASEGPPPPFLREALSEASKSPLDDMTSRLVMASPRGHKIQDFSIFKLASVFDTQEPKNLPEVRAVAARGLLEALGGTRPPPEDVLTFMGLSLFDREFTVGANRGKTFETGWNTLALAVDGTATAVTVERRALRIDYPEGVLDLSFDALMRPFTR